MTTSRQIFEGLLTELSKVNAPSLSLNEFNYYFNKAIQLFVNKRYNVLDLNQLAIDDTRVLKATAYLQPSLITALDNQVSLSNLGAATNLTMYGATYEIKLPGDYLHLLNCICIYKVKKNHGCYDGGSYVQIPAKRLTADAWSTVINDYYNRPTPERPYYYIHNVNTNSEGYPTNPRVLDATNGYVSGTDMTGLYSVTSNGAGATLQGTGAEGSYTESLDDKAKSNFDRTLKLSENVVLSNIEKATAHRPVNPSIVRCEIRYGKDNSVFELLQVQVDYIKVPLYIRLTQELVDLTEDFSQIMEFPDNVCQEITNELVHLVMERVGDQRLGTHFLVSLSVALPGQQQAQPQALAAQ